MKWKQKEYLSWLGLVKIPKHIGLNNVHSSFLCFRYQIWPHLHFNNAFISQKRLLYLFFLLFFSLFSFKSFICEREVYSRQTSTHILISHHLISCYNTTFNHLFIFYIFFNFFYFYSIYFKSGLKVKYNSSL